MSSNSGATDGDLLTRFVANGDAEAFAQLVRRHAPMVHRLCARLSRTPQDAEDAAQTVFITLAGKAASLTARTSLAGWLHRTACHVALRWRRTADNRRAHERRAAELRPDRIEGGAGAAAGGAVDGDVDDATDPLHRALGALPEDYRNAMILHHLEGHTIEQVAELLATRPGTVAARLSRGRTMLRDRLAAIVGASAAVALPGVDELLAQERAAALPAAVVDAIERSVACPAASVQLAATATAATATVTAAPLTLAAHVKAASALLALSAAAFAASGAAAYRFTAPPPEAQAVAVAEPEPATPIVLENSAETVGLSVPEPTGLTWLVPAVALLARPRRAGR
jgi:RNA polymerase sigma factor (sigma-70 family)